MRRIILASKSPRRRELLSQGGYDFEIIPAKKEEIISHTKPGDIVRELSYAKAMEVYDIALEKYGYNDIEKYLVIGADTIVAAEDCILGKPSDKEDAYRMLNMLQGNTHKVYTGVSIAYREQNENKCHSFYEETEVSFYPMSDDEIRQYISTGSPSDKAGAYGIQDSCALYIKGIRGDYNNVVGLPLGRLYQELKNLNI